MGSCADQNPEGVPPPEPTGRISTKPSGFSPPRLTYVTARAPLVSVFSHTGKSTVASTTHKCIFESANATPATIASNSTFGVAAFYPVISQLANIKTKLWSDQYPANIHEGIIDISFYYH